MDFSWSDEQLAYRAQVAEFARQQLQHDVTLADTTASYPRDLWRKCAEFGLLRMLVPRAHGGAERDVLTAALALEAFGYECPNSALTLALCAQIWTVQQPLADFGSAAQQADYLPRLSAGEIVGVQAVTEANAGSDAGSLATLAVPCDGGYRLSGTKIMITGAPIADIAVVLANSAPERGKWGISAFLVDLHATGVTCSAPRDKLGLRSIPFGDIELHECFVPSDRRLGPEGAGLSLLNATLEWERSGMLAGFVGVMQRQFEEAVAYVKQREQFGSAIGNFQAVSHRIADMRVRLETARLLLYKALWLKRHGAPAALETAMVKLHLSECFLASSMDALRQRGGHGYLSDATPQRDLRDAIGGTLYGGTSDIQRNIIAKLSGL